MTKQDKKLIEQFKDSITVASLTVELVKELGYFTKSSKQILNKIGYRIAFDAINIEYRGETND